MAVYSLMYDLVKERSSYDYQPLWDELKRLDAHPTQLSVWLVNLNNSQQEVHDHFKRFIDSDDRLMVVKMFKSEYTYSNAKAGTNDWLKRNPPQDR